MPVPIDEQETVIQISRNERMVNIYTSDTMVMTKLDKIYPVIKEFVHKGGEVQAKEYECDKSLISFRAKKQQRNLTDEQRAAIAERFRAMRRP